MTNNDLNESYGTLSETINGLMKAGYTHDFNIREECLVCNITNEVLPPEDFQIDKTYRFEGETNPDDQSIVYAISSSKFNMKGVLVNGYGISADEATSKLVEKLQTNPGADNTVEVKSNEATPQRPEGDRVVNAPLVEMDLDKFIELIKSESTWKESDRNSITIFKSDTLRIVLMGLHKDAEMKPHSANGVISVQVLEGEIKFSTDQQTCRVSKGKMIALHEQITHSVQAVKETFLLLTLAMNAKR